MFLVSASFGHVFTFSSKTWDVCENMKDKKRVHLKLTPFKLSCSQIKMSENACIGQDPESACHPPRFNSVNGPKERELEERCLL